ncbi:hypothetical protein ACDA63_18160 [Uliginosibacterium sp. sgz301328]|uniref:hypothetical protein n=1 Tax=Uliginosibacterium sp. sgz301328 TaxID=3243764 RepID=UPI00359D0AB3
MPNVYLPLSGDVSQAFSAPWTWMSRLAAGQIGLVNINFGKSADPTLEQRILEDVGSYGRQIGQLADALDAVLKNLPVETWDKPARDAVDAFHYQLREVRRLKAARHRERQG